MVNNDIVFQQRLSNGTIDPDSEVNRVIELQDTVEKQNSELTSARTRLLELNNKITELEETSTTATKDLNKTQEQLVKLQRDLREVRFTESRQVTVSEDLMSNMWLSAGRVDN